MGKIIEVCSVEVSIDKDEIIDDKLLDSIVDDYYNHDYDHDISSIKIRICDWDNIDYEEVIYYVIFDANGKPYYTSNL